MLRLIARPRLQLWPSVAAAIVFAVAFAAGHWQSGRAHEKDLIEGRHAALRDAPAIALPRQIAPAELESIDGRRITARGEFLNDKTVFLDNQVLNRVAGYHVLTPFRAQDGALVLVNRGWVAMGKTRAALPAVVPVAGGVLIDGRAMLPPQRIYEIKPEARQGPVWQNLQLNALSRHLGLDLLPFVLRLGSDGGNNLGGLGGVGSGVGGGVAGGKLSNPNDGLVRIADAPGPAAVGTGGMTAAKHRGYAFQWYSLAGLVACLFLFFTFFERTGQHGQSSRNA